MNVRGARVSLQLAVADLETTEAFYGGILQLPIERGLTVPGAPEHLIMRLGNAELIFVDEAEVLSAHPFLEALLTAYPRGGGTTIHICVVDIERINDHLLDEDIEVLYPLERKPYGIKDLWCFDPDGYLLVLEEPCKRREP